MRFKRILLKLSGESLMGEQGYGIDVKRLGEYAQQIKEAADMGVQIGIVIGGGNIFRGLTGAGKGFDRVKGDQMGMCATVINSLALSSALGAIGQKNRVLTAIRMEPIGEFYSKWKAIEAMEKEFEIEIPRGELSYVLLHLRGAKMAYTGEEQELPGDIGDDRLLPMVDRMIDAYDKTIANELKEDEEFLRGLLIHLRPVLVRLSTGLRIYNPVLDDIREEYGDIFEACRRASQVITEETGYEVSEEEVGFLAMHFGAAQERVRENKQYTRKVNIGIVCASGFGVARLMMTRLKDKLGDRAILKAYGKGEINKYVVSGTDFFISTMNLDQLPVDYIQVSPLIPPKDLVKIEYKLEDYSHIKRDTSETPFNRRLDEAYFLIREIKSIIRRYRRMETSENIRFRELLQFLSMQVTESLHAAAALRDSVEQRERLNSQIFPDLGIALLHCRSGAVREPVFISCTPRGTGNFKDPYFKGIRAALLMVMPVDDDRKMHAEVLGSISGAMVTNEYFLRVIKTGREDEIRAELARELKCFFFDHLDRV